MTEAKESEETDQYDSLLRGMESDLLITINGQLEAPRGSGELRVVYAKDNETHVSLRSGETCYRIHRNRGGKLVYSEETRDGLSFEDNVLTIEVLGIA